MHILVTGGAGFIGGTLIQALLKRGHEVTCVDNFNDYYDPAIKEAHTAEYAGRITVHRVDLADAAALKKVFEASPPFDAVAHLAAQAGVRYSMTHPEVSIQSNYIGTFNVLELIKKHAIPHMVFASTSSVYGDTKVSPCTEDTPTDTPLSLYAATKKGGELLCSTYHAAGSVRSITCLRFFSVYGPWNRPDMALYIFTKNIIEGKPIDVYGNGAMSRDFTYVDDIVSGFVAALEKPLGFEIINLGCGSPVPLMRYIELIEQSVGKSAQKNMLPMQPGDVKNTCASIEKAKQLLDLRPQVSVDEGVPKFVEWYRRYYGV